MPPLACFLTGLLVLLLGNATQGLGLSKLSTNWVAQPPEKGKLSASGLGWSESSAKWIARPPVKGKISASAPCEDEIKVKLLQRPQISRTRSTILNCTHDHKYSELLVGAFYTGSTMLFAYEFMKGNPLNFHKLVPYYWAYDYYFAIEYEIPSCHYEEDFSCHMVNRAKGDGQDSIQVTDLDDLQIYQDGKCLTCGGSVEIYIPDGTNITLSCHATKARPELELVWDSPLDLEVVEEKSTPIEDCDGLYVNQVSVATAVFDGTEHWHVCCMAKGEQGIMAKTSAVTIRDRAQDIGILYSRMKPTSTDGSQKSEN